MTDLKTNWVDGQKLNPADVNAIAAAINAAAAAIAGAYAKPGSGIPSADLSDAVQTALSKATSAFQAPAVVAAGVDKAAARTALGMLDLYVEDFSATDFVWGVNDTAPWQAAIDAAHTAGVATRIHARPGRVYKLNPLKVYSNTVLDGHGATLQPITRVGGTNVWDAVVYTAGCVPANGCTGDGATVVTNVEIRDFIFDTQARAYSTILAANAKAIAVRFCSFPANQTRIAIRFDQNTDQCVAEGNRIVSTFDTPFGTIVNAQGVSCASATVDATGGAYGSYGTATVNTSAFTDPTNLSQRHKIINNWIENGTHGVALSGAIGCLVEGNTITDPSHRGVILSQAARNVIVGNVVRGQFSCAFLLCFGSKFNVVADNMAYCTTSVSEFNAFRASYGACDNMFSGNYAYGATGAAFRAFTGSNNNSFIGNKAENCGIGLEFRSLVTDDGYQQNINTPTMVGNSAQGNHFIDCAVGIQLRAGTTTVGGTTPATTAGTVIAIQRCSIVGNTIQGATTYGVLFIEDTAGSITAVVAAGNALMGNTADWQTSRNVGHFTSFLGNNGSGMPSLHQLPAAGNSVEWRDLAGALKAYIGQSGSMVTYGRRAAGSSVASTVAIDYVNTSGVGSIGRRMDGQSGQTADLDQWTINAGPNATVIPASRINNQGGFVTAVHAAPADANLAAGDMAIWFDQTNGAAKLMIKAKQADGTVRTGSVALS